MTRRPSLGWSAAWRQGAALEHPSRALLNKAFLNDHVTVMFLPFELAAQLRGRGGVRRGHSAKANVGGAMGTLRLLAYLPLALLVTVSTIVAPAALAVALAPRGDIFWVLASSALAVAGSLMVARLEAAIWTRCPGSRDLTFADLMLWGWLRRCVADRRLAEATASYEAIKDAGLEVSIELLEELSERLAARDAYTHGHNQRVARHAERIATAMHLTPTEIAQIRTAAMVHDVGKIYTPREILNNPDKLSEREYAIVKLHPGDGADMLADAGDPQIAEIVRHHHEQMDGRGYPDGLAGLDIPLGARIVAVADTFDAITSSRPYRSAGTHKRALDTIAANAGSQFDEVVVAAFTDSYAGRRSIVWFSLAAMLPQRLLLALQAVSPGIAAGSGASAGSLLPALGAAGLLALSPALPHGAPGESAAPAQGAPARSGALAAQRAAAVSPRRGSATSSAPGSSGAHRGGRRGAARSHGTVPHLHTGLAGGPVVRRGSTPHAQGPTRASTVSVTTSGSSAPSDPKASEAPSTSSPGPTSPSSPTGPSAPPKVPSLPVGEGSQSPSLPSVPSVPVPSVPVTVPSLPVSVPATVESVANVAESLVKGVLGGKESAAGQ